MGRVRMARFIGPRTPDDGSNVAFPHGIADVVE
jgi:hypothetical protein